MAISRTALERYLAQVPGNLPPFKGMHPNDLGWCIYNATGRAIVTHTAPRPWQLEGTAFALYQRSALIFYDPRMGKGIYNNWLVCTPQGWRPMSSIRVGDYVMAPTGLPVKVTGVFPQGVRELYTITFSDGAETVCDDEHVWSVNSHVRRSRGDAWQKKTTYEIRTGPLKSSSHYRYYIPMPKAVKYQAKKLPIDPYTLGVLLGDGYLGGKAVTVTTDLAIVKVMPLPLNTTYGLYTKKGYTYTTGAVFKRIDRQVKASLIPALEELGLIGTHSESKFIPPDYLRASVPQRLALLAGLLDTDGWTTRGTNNLGWGSVSPQLALNVQELVRSLGGTFTMRIKEPTYTYKGEKRQGQTYYFASIRLPSALGCPFRLKRKADTWKPLTKFQPVRAIKSITPYGRDHSTCISVDSADGLFVVWDYVVTHNSKLALDWASHLRAANLWREGKALILAHAPIAAGVWQDECDKHSTFKVRVVGTQMDDWIDAIESDCECIITTCYSLQELCTVTGTSRKGASKLYPDNERIRMMASYFRVAIIDEIHSYQNHSALRFQITNVLTEQCLYRIGLTGTPFGRDPFAIWAQAFLIDRGAALGYNYYFFERAFGKQKKNWATKRTEYEFDKDKMPLLRRKLDGLAFSYRFDQVQTIQVEHNLVRLHMYGKQLDAYAQAITRMIQISETEQVEILNTFVRLRQIASGFLPVTGADGVARVMHFDENPKLEWLRELIPAMPSDVQVVLFHEFTESGAVICKALTEFKATHAWLYGGTKDDAATLREFTSGKAQYLVANTRKGGMSIDLPMADCMIFFESPTSPITRRQAEMRPMSRGSKLLMIEDLVVSGVEQRILDFMTEGKDLMDSIVHERRRLLDEFHVLKQRTAGVWLGAPRTRKKRATSTT